MSIDKLQSGTEAGGAELLRLARTTPAQMPSWGLPLELPLTLLLVLWWVKAGLSLCWSCWAGRGPCKPNFHLLVRAKERILARM